MQVVPAARRGRSTRRRREVAWVALLTLVMTTGVLGVLLLSTAMQRQSVALTHEQQVVSDLATRSQALRTSLQHEADPARLATRARQLHMHPATKVRWVHGVSRH